MKREACASCVGTDREVILDLGISPLADRFPASPSSGEDWYSLKLLHCRQCGLVQLSEVVPDDELWSADYAFHSGASPALVRYFQTYAFEIKMEHSGPLRNGLVVEIACNDGTLLEELKPHARNLLGIDPAAGPVNVARNRGFDVIAEPFGLELAKRVRDERGSAGILIANNVAAHVANMRGFFEGFAHLLADDGVGYIEVQYLPDLVLGNGFDHVYHEHRQFFTVDVLARELTAHGLRVRRILHTSAQGGSLRIQVEKVPRGTFIVHGDSVQWLRMRESWLRRQGAYSDLQPRADMVRERLVELIDIERNQGRTVIGYGASAKSCTLLNWCGIGADRVPYVEDTTPAKIGRFTPGTGIPIREPAPYTDPRKTTYLLLVHNYLSSVLRRENEFMAKGGRIIVPIPVPVIL